MRNLTILIFLVLSGLSLQAHNKSIEQDPIFNKVDTYPSYTGGFTAFIAYLKKNLHAGTDKGRVIATFVVEKDGSISNIEIIRAFSEKAGVEATRVIKQMPKWEPGMDKGKIVRVQYTIPISFPTI
jgi:outer membrane biosynthesis protein TonB